MEQGKSWHNYDCVVVKVSPFYLLAFPMSNESSPQLQAPSNTLDEHFASFAARVEKIDEAIDVNDHQSLVAARGNLAEIILELEKLHVDEVIGKLDNKRF